MFDVDFTDYFVVDEENIMNNNVAWWYNTNTIWQPIVLFFLIISEIIDILFLFYIWPQLIVFLFLSLESNMLQPACY